MDCFGNLSPGMMQEEQSQPQQVDESREPDGQAPSEPPEEQKRREDDILAKAAVIRSLRTTLSFVDKGPWPEPQRPTDQWAYALREVKWLAADFAQVIGMPVDSFLSSRGGSACLVHDFSCKANNLPRTPSHQIQPSGSGCIKGQKGLPNVLFCRSGDGSTLLPRLLPQKLLDLIAVASSRALGCLVMRSDNRSARLSNR